MARELKVAVIGSCLSNMPAVFLVNEYGCRRLNNAAIGRSDQFVERYIDGVKDLPPLDVMASALGITPDDELDLLRYLRENYVEHGGLTELDCSLPSLMYNLNNEEFDVILLDNLVDIQERRVVWSHGGRDFRFTFPVSRIASDHQIHDAARCDDLLTTDQSVSNWIKIIDFIRSLQPTARIIFLLTHSCTSSPESERYQRTREFAEAFPKAIGDRDIQVIPQLDLSPDLTKGEGDWAHFDMRIYKALAGYIYTSMVSGWTPHARSAVIGRRHSVTPVLAPWRAPPPLCAVIADNLGIDPAAVSEASGIDATENWDSLRQVGLMTAIESAFGVRISFEESIGANSVSSIREVLGARGVIAPDDPRGVENLFSRFVARALENPNAIYAKVVRGDQYKGISYGDVLRICAALHQRLFGIKRGEIVAIILDHSEYLYATFIGSILMGYVPTMLPPPTRKQDPNIYREGLEVLFSRICPAAVLTTQAHMPLLERLATQRIVAVDEMEPASWPETMQIIQAPPGPVAPNTLAFLQHSSGTTGHKKGVMLTHAVVMEQVKLYADAIGIQSEDVVASWLPLYHDMGLVTSFIVPTIVGCPIVSLDALEWVTRPTMLFEAIERERATFAWLPNFAFHHIARTDPGDRVWDLSSLKSLISCSEPCRAESFALFAEKYGPMGCGREKLSTSYAMAENVFAISQSQPGSIVRPGEGAAAPYLSSGRLLKGVEVEIRVDGQPQPDGVLGEIFVRSTTLFRGYYALPELTAERLVDGWYATRDLGLLSEGEITVVGRVDDLLIVRGKNIVAHEVEDDLNAVDGVAPGRILVGGMWDDESASQELLVIAELKSENADPPVVEAAIRERVFTLCGVSPRRVRIVPKGFLVKSTSGKIARARSLQKYHEAVSASR